MTITRAIHSVARGCSKPRSRDSSKTRGAVLVCGDAISMPRFTGYVKPRLLQCHARFLEHPLRASLCRKQPSQAGLLRMVDG